MKDMAPHYFSDPYAHQATKRLETIVSDKDMSRGQKLISLMLEAKEICKHQLPLPPIQKQIDLFSELPPPDPYAQCVNYFLNTMHAAKMNERFHPAQVIEYEQQSTSVWACAYQIKTKDGEKYPELKNFMKLVKESFPKEIKEQIKTERQEKDHELYERSLVNDYKSGKKKTEAFRIFQADLSPNYRYMLLMHNAARALKEKPHTDLNDPYNNPELLVSLHLTNGGKGKHKRGNMLDHIFKGEVQPRYSARHPGNPDKYITPLQYAQELSQAQGLETLGAIFTERLVKHQQALELSRVKPYLFKKAPKYS